MEEDATPGRPRIDVVVGEGQPTRRGLLRFVLEGEGFRVLAEATTTPELVRVLAIHRPDVVVLDDGVGASAVVVVREMHPDTKIVLVWPPDVLPISGDATVDPTEVLRELGPAVERACGHVQPPPSASVRTLPRRPDAASRQPHPSGGMADVVPGPGVARARREDEPVVVDREPAPVLILPVTPVVEREPRP
ncbi:MAG: hypothetical protein ACXVEI_05395 [Actinomycetota bacterium]